MNKNYVNGRAKEYRIMKQLKKDGCEIVLRSAGSHSPIDVLGINLEKREIRFIQAKPKSMSDNARKKLEMEHMLLNDEFLCSFEVV